MLKRLWAAVLAAGLIGGAAHAADEAVTIKIKKTAKGDVVTETKTEDVDTTIQASLNGMKQTIDQGGSSKMAYTEEVLEKGEKDKKATKLKRTYQTFDVTKAGKKLDLKMEGKTVLIEKGKEKYTFSQDGGEVAKEVAELLDKEFNKKDEDEMEDLMLPKKAVKAGDTWEVDAKSLSKVFEDEMTVDAAKAKVSGKLVKLYDKDKAKWGVIEFTLDLPVTAVTVGPDTKADATAGSKLKVTLTLDACVDGTVYGGTSTAKIEGEVGMKANGADITVTTNSKMESKAEPAKKK
jgi:hypothetical protein